MKVKCIDVNDWDYLTIGKIYDVIYIDDDGSYTIMDDEGYEDEGYPDEWFITLSEIRNEKIDRLLDETN